MADEGQPTEQISKQNKILVHIPVFAKLLEVILSIFAIGLIVDPFNSFQQIFNKPRFKLDDAAFIYISIGSYVLINSLFIISHVLGDRVPKRTLILFASMGAFLHVIAASLLVHNWRMIHAPPLYPNNAIIPSKQYMDMIIAGAFFTFFNSAVFTTEVFLTVKFSTKAP